MSSTPLVSVVMPVYNAARYLRDAVESVLDQSLTDFELIAVNDGSTDESESILADFAERDARVRLISRPNTGIVGALNDGLAAASGRYIARMDGDDICLQTRLADQVDYMERHPDVVLLGGRIRTIDLDGDPISDRAVIIDHDAIESALLSGRTSVIVHPTTMMRRDTVLRIGGYRDFDSSEDLDIYLRLLEHGRATNIDRTVLLYRVHATSLSNSNREDRIIANRTRILAEARSKRGLPPLEGGASMYHRDEDEAARHKRFSLAAAASGYGSSAFKHWRSLRRVQGTGADTWVTAARALRLFAKHHIKRAFRN